MLMPTKSVSNTAKTLRIAIVEDNATARTNLRSHIMGIDNFDVASYSNGNELRNGLRLNNFDLVLMDFHLGQSKNGVEWIHFLKQRDLFTDTTGLVFITSDSMPQTIGQILDLHPDFILIKPYTIKSLHLNLAHFLNLRKETLPILGEMVKDNHKTAINMINQKLSGDVNKRFRNDFHKLKGRLLLADKQYSEAANLYNNILQKSSNVLWAHWGLIKSEYFMGHWQKCQELLNHLISASLTKDKAFEWLASVAIGKEEFKEAEYLLDNIKESELTMQATRLKVLSYNMQDKHDAAQNLLEKKIQNNLSVKDRMSEYSLELARFHIQLAESLVSNESKAEKNDVAEEKQESLQTARKLITRAKRTNNDRQAELQKDYLLALAHVVEGNNEQAAKILDQTGSHELTSKAEATTMVDAVKVWFGVGQPEKAQSVLQECDEHLLQQDNHIDRLICSELICDIEESYHLQKDRALQSNEKGTQLYQAKEYTNALLCFSKAYKMFPGIPAFSLNLLQCMSDLTRYEFQGLEAQQLYEELLSVDLSEKNEKRLKQIKLKLSF